MKAAGYGLMSAAAVPANAGSDDTTVRLWKLP